MTDRTEMMQAVLRANGQYLTGQPAEAGIDGVCIVVTCMDPRLNRHLPAALGLQVAQCFMVRNAGATVTPHDNSILRSCALAAAMWDAKCIIVLGHTGCATACTVVDLTTTLEQAGVPRAAVDADLRGWFGLIDEPGHAVRRTAEELARCPAVREDLPVLGLVINTDDGKLREVYSTVTAWAAGAGLQSKMGPVNWTRGDIGSQGPAMAAGPPAPAKPESAEQVSFVTPIPLAEPPKAVAPPKPPPTRPAQPKRPPPPPPRRPVGAVDEAAEALNRVAKDIQARLRQQRNRNQG